MPRRVSESARPVSESDLWRLLARFYGDRGLDVWRAGSVPQRVTSQGYLADVYAAVISAFGRDLDRQGFDATPLIVEVGGGSGLSAWLLLNRLMRHHPDGNESPRFEYLLTEVSLDHVRDWARIDRLRRLVEEGTLHLGPLEIDGPAPAGVTTLDGLRLDLAHRPIVLIANYVMDTLPCDLYRARGGRLFKEFVTIEGGLQDDDGVPTLAGVALEFESREVNPPYTGHPGVDEIIERTYRDLPDNPCIPVSMPFVSFLEPLLRSDAPLLLLAADLAYTTPEFGTDPPFVRQNYIACTANFHLIGQLFEQRGGTTRFTQHADSVFSVGAFIRSSDGVDLVRTREAARVAIGSFGPHDALNIEQALTAHTGALDFSMVSAWARLARYDPCVTGLCIPHLLRIIEADEDYQRPVLRVMLFEAFRLELPDVTDEDSLATQIAYVLFKAGMYGDVLDFLDLASSQDEGNSECVHLGAVAAQRLGDEPRARSLFGEIAASEPDYWKGWPAQKSDVDAQAVLAADDGVHCDHVVLRMAVAEFRRMETPRVGR
jgi:hypothetical protein